MLNLNDVKLDWLAFSFDTDEYIFSKFDRFMTLFPELKCQEEVNTKRVFSHYEKSYYCGHDIYVFYDSEDSMQNKGCNCVIPAHALEYFMNLLGASSVPDLMQIIIDRGCKFSRLDFAFDDMTKTFMPLQYFVWWQNDQFKSKFKVAHFDHGADGGTTFSLGNRAGLRYLRIYDKDIESKGEIPSVRYEFEFHSYTADALGHQLANKDNFTFHDFITSMFCIIENTGKKQKCREKELMIWKSWVLNLKFNEEIISIHTNMPAKSFEKSVYWFEKYVAKTLAKMYLVFGKQYILETAGKATLHLSDTDLQTIIESEEILSKGR